MSAEYSHDSQNDSIRVETTRQFDYVRRRWHSFFQFSRAVDAEQLTSWMVEALDLVDSDLDCRDRAVALDIAVGHEVDIFMDDPGRQTSI
jgi:hypothetical protein